jgi:hypothetical protein
VRKVRRGKIQSTVPAAEINVGVCAEEVSAILNTHLMITSGQGTRGDSEASKRYSLGDWGVNGDVGEEMS